MTKSITLVLRKGLASTVNCLIAFACTSPVYYFGSLDAWRWCCVGFFFLYNLALSDRCFGMMVVGTYQAKPTSLLYATAYTVSFCTLVWWIWVPLDLALTNGLFIQLPCLLLRGNTAHALIAGARTMTEAELLFECAMKGECPDCHRSNFRAKGSRVWCASCYSQFMVDNCSITRIEVDPRTVRTAAILEFGGEKHRG